MLLTASVPRTYPERVLAIARHAPSISEHFLSNPGRCPNVSERFPKNRDLAGAESAQVAHEEVGGHAEARPGPNASVGHGANAKSK